MIGVREFMDFAARTLDVPAESLSLETSLGQLPQWDSMAHLRLVMAVSREYSTEIPFAEVTTTRSLWEFWRRINQLPPKKVVAVDLDNTLWRGVVGEDGIDHIRPDTEFQRRLKALKSRGVLLVALSKNNPQDVAWLFDSAAPSLPGMALSADDFVTWRVNWESKADNLRSVADELNLGTDAFVLVDDNPAERMAMEAALPDVTIAAFPPNLEAYFPEHALTEEDRVKTEQYRAEAERARFLATPDAQPIFERLGIRLDVHELKADEVTRVAQLSQKANQFNALSVRRNEEDVRRLAADGLVAVVKAADNFGDHGIVAFVAIGGGEITDWVMSCRVAGRGIEERFMREVEALAKARGVKSLRATWRDSGRNAPARDLFDRAGFTLTEATETERHYERVLG